MVIIFIVILVIGLIIAVWFNVWNIRNPVGGKGKKKKVIYNLKPEPTSVVNNEQYKEQTARVLKMMNEYKRSAV